MDCGDKSPLWRKDRDGSHAVPKADMSALPERSARFIRLRESGDLSPQSEGQSPQP
jgi:hypothetical protein